MGLNKFSMLMPRSVKCMLLIITALFFAGANAQPNLYFINRAKHKIVEVKAGHQLSIKYRGYLGQTEFVKQTVTDVNDSMITLGYDPEMFGRSKALLENNPKFVYRKIMIRDILAFRRVTPGRQLLKVGLLTANIIVTYYLLTDLFKTGQYTTGQTLLISFGVGIGTSVMINILFPENPKYQLQDGWEIQTGFVKPAQ